MRFKVMNRLLRTNVRSVQLNVNSLIYNRRMNRLRPLMNGWSTTAIPFCPLFSAKYSTITGTNEYIYNLIKEKKIVVFMKGTPDAPNCGFSNAVVQILKFHGVNNYDSYNVLEDESLRQGIKDYSQWPTIPQVYINGDFIGGCDVMLEMHKNGDLIEELKKAGLRSALLDK